MTRQWRFAFGLWTMPPTAQDVLAVGERALAWEGVALMPGDARIGKDPRGRAVTGFSFDPVAGGIQSDDGLIERAIGGIAATGALGSSAAEWVSALNHAGQRPHLLLTDQRLLLVVDDRAPDESRDRRRKRSVRTLTTTPRNQVRAVRHRPRLLAFGRIQLDFADGSRIALLTGVISWRPARRIVAAMGG